MKPITHPLAIAYVEACSSGSDAYPPMRAWNDAGRPLYADPTPMPAPALGMRVWVTKLDIGGDGAHKVRNYDVVRLAPGATWADYTNDGDTIDIITDFRTGEVLWRRS